MAHGGGASAGRHARHHGGIIGPIFMAYWAARYLRHGISWTALLLTMGIVVVMLHFGSVHPCNPDLKGC